MLKKVRTMVGLAGIALALSSWASAAVLQILYLDEMVGESPVIVHATVLSARAEWNASGSTLRTVYKARAHRYLKGFLGETFEFQEPGGRLGNMVQMASGVPRFEAGEEAVLFLWTDGRSGRYQCIGLEQGALRIRQEGVLKVVNRSIPVRAEQSGEARLAIGSSARTSGTRRELHSLLAEVAAAKEQAEAATRREAR